MPGCRRSPTRPAALAVIGRLVLLHRVGAWSSARARSVVASTPHRPEAFAAARFAIDALKASVPIWKHEVWSEGRLGVGAAGASRSVGSDRLASGVG